MKSHWHSSTQHKWKQVIQNCSQTWLWDRMSQTSSHKKLSWATLECFQLSLHKLNLTKSNTSQPQLTQSPTSWWAHIPYWLPFTAKIIWVKSWHFPWNVVSSKFNNSKRPAKAWQQAKTNWNFFHQITVPYIALFKAIREMQKGPFPVQNVFHQPAKLCQTPRKLPEKILKKHYLQGRTWAQILLLAPL